MDSFPSFEEFETKYNAGKPQLVWTSLVADLETPVSAFIKLAETKPNSFLLESVEGGAIRGRYSFIGMKPDIIWRCFGNKAEINRKARFDSHSFVEESVPTLESLNNLVEESRIDLPDNLPPMAAGVVGYMAYDNIRLVENIPANNPDSMNTPDGIFVRPTVMAVFDNIEDMVTIIT
ncbi:MAG: anthranilate synthase component I, partial [Alphaproteobacteria bacterium]|nr:anthranilate synthase component I [Alphaproteobacteria bacterium]